MEYIKSNGGVIKIYKAVNARNGKVYIGLTTKTLKSRIMNHYKRCRRNKDKSHFMSALRKYKKEDFVWDIIDECTTNIDDLKDMEVAWIHHYNSYNNGYNSTIGGDGTIGVKWSEKRYETMAKHSKGNSNALGYKHTDEAKEKIAQASLSRTYKTGHKASEEHKAKISKALKGGKRSVKTRMKIGGAKEKINKEDARKIIEMYNTGKYTHKSLGLIFGVDRSTIGYIINKRKFL